MAKRKKYDRETWDLMESVTMMIRPGKDDNGNYRLKKGFKKKDVKRIRRQCPHWVLDKKGRPVTAVKLLRDRNGNPTGEVQCRVCRAIFPLIPSSDPDEYVDAVEKTEELVNQIEYWDVYAGGSKENMKMFLALRQYLPRFVKVAGRVAKAYKNKDKMSATTEAAKHGAGFGFHTNQWIET